MSYRINLSSTLKKKIHKKYNYECADCKKKDLVMHIHHIKPIYKRGDNSEDNLTLLCRKCHYEKHKDISWVYTIYKSNKKCPVCKKADYKHIFDNKKMIRICPNCNYENHLSMSRFLELSTNLNYIESCFKYLKHIEVKE